MAQTAQLPSEPVQKLLQTAVRLDLIHPVENEYPRCRHQHSKAPQYRQRARALVDRFPEQTQVEVFSQGGRHAPAIEGVHTFQPVQSAAERDRLIEHVSTAQHSGGDRDRRRPVPYAHPDTEQQAGKKYGGSNAEQDNCDQPLSDRQEMGTVSEPGYGLEGAAQIAIAVYPPQEQDRPRFLEQSVQHGGREHRRQLGQGQRCMSPAITLQEQRQSRVTFMKDHKI